MLSCRGGHGLGRKATITFFSVLLASMALQLRAVNAHESSDEDRGLRFLAPVAGQVIRPGQSIEVRLAPDPGVSIHQIVVTIGGLFNGLSALELHEPPWEGTLQVSDSLVGPQRISALGASIDPQTGRRPENKRDGFVYASVAIEIIPEGKPVALRWMNPRVERLEIGGDPRRARGKVEFVLALYPDGETYRLPLPGVPLSYDSHDESIATVDADGQLTAVSPGITYITVRAGEVAAFYQVIVKAAGTRLPGVDVTQRVRIDLGPWHRPPEPNQVGRRVTITNVSSLPLPLPLYLVIRDVPERVHQLHGKAAFFKVDSRDFLSPGASAWVDARFNVRDIRPVEFSSSVYAGGEP